MEHKSNLCISGQQLVCFKHNLAFFYMLRWTGVFLCLPSHIPARRPEIALKRLKNICLIESCEVSLWKRWFCLFAKHSIKAGSSLCSLLPVSPEGTISLRPAGRGRSRSWERVSACSQNSGDPFLFSWKVVEVWQNGITEGRSTKGFFSCTSIMARGDGLSGFPDENMCIWHELL